jgi:hypothetical protein
MSYGNYLQGSTDSTNNTYNLLISGAPGGYTSSGINIGGDTSTTYGVKITSDSTHNAFMDVRGDASNKIAFRHKDQTSGTVTAMLDLINDSSLTGSGYGATVNGRVNASSYYVGSVDTRAPTSTGVYMGTDGNVGYFNINKGSGTGGFAFKTYNADGTLLQSNLNLMSSGVVQASYYTASGNSDDSESVAVMGIDASGNLVRDYNINKRYRAIEARLTASESSVNGPLSAKVNEIVTRINGLNFFSQTISTLSGVTNSSPAPASSPTPAPPRQTTTMYGEYINIALSSASAITSYIIGCAQAGIRQPTQYALLGSTDEQKWDVIDQTPSNVSYSGFFSTRSVTANFKYYRIVVQSLADLQYWYLIINYIGLFNNGTRLFSAGNTISGSDNHIITNGSLTATVTISWISNTSISGGMHTNTAGILINDSNDFNTLYNTAVVGWSVWTNEQVNYLQTLYPSGNASASCSATTVYV